MMIMIRTDCYSIKLYHGHDDNDKNCYDNDKNCYNKTVPRTIKLYHGHDDNDKKW